jgi:hypothetical protein
MKSTDMPFKRLWIDIVPVGQELVGLGDQIHPSGCRYILVIVDDHSKWLELVPLRRTNLETIAMGLLSRWFVYYGIPEEIVSDATNILEGKEANEIWKTYGIQKVSVAPYHQSSNGLVERAIGTVVNIVRCWLGTEERRWVELLPMVAGVMRNRVGKSGKSPYEIVFGRKMTTPLDATLQQVYTAETERLKEIVMQHQVLETGKGNDMSKMKISDRQVEEVNQKEREKRRSLETEWKVGELVFYRNERPAHKFAPRWLGPRRITKLVSQHLLELKGGIRRHTQQIRRADEKSGKADMEPKRKRKEKRYEVERIVDLGSSKE